MQKAPLHTTQGQALTKQSLQRVSLQKQSVGVQALSMTEGDKLPGRSSSLVTLSATPLPTSKLKPLESSAVPSRVSRETAARSKQNASARPRAEDFSAQERSLMRSGSLSAVMSKVQLESHPQKKDKARSVAQETPIAHLQSQAGGFYAARLPTRRLPLMGQRTELRPVSAMQRPVARCKFRLKRK